MNTPKGKGCDSYIVVAIRSETRLHVAKGGRGGKLSGKKATPVHMSSLLHTINCLSKKQFRPNPKHVEINGIRSLITFRFAKVYSIMLKQPAHC